MLLLSQLSRNSVSLLLLLIFLLFPKNNWLNSLAWLKSPQLRSWKEKLNSSILPLFLTRSISSSPDLLKSLLKRSLKTRLVNSASWLFPLKASKKFLVWHLNLPKRRSLIELPSLALLHYLLINLKSLTVLLILLLLKNSRNMLLLPVLFSWIAMNTLHLLDQLATPPSRRLKLEQQHLV